MMHCYVCNPCLESGLFHSSITHLFYFSVLSPVNRLYAQEVTSTNQTKLLNVPLFFLCLCVCLCLCSPPIQPSPCTGSTIQTSWKKFSLIWSPVPSFALSQRIRSTAGRLASRLAMETRRTCCWSHWASVEVLKYTNTQQMCVICLHEVTRSCPLDIVVLFNSQ